MRRPAYFGANRTFSAVQLVDLRIWAKWSESHPIPHYPLAAHLIDTALVFDLLWRNWASPNLRAQLAAASGTNPHLLGTALARIAGLHDLGKANPVFQGQQAASVPRADMTSHLDELCERTGLWNGDGVDGRAVLIRRHEAVTGAYLSNNDIEHGYLDSLDSLITCGHHGHYRIPGDLTWDDNYLTFHDRLAPGWREQAQAHQHLVEQVTGQETLPSTVPTYLLPFLTGIVCLSDWLASRDDSIAHGSNTLADLPTELLTSDSTRWAPTFAEQRRPFLAGIVAQLGTPTPPRSTFAQTFGFPPDRPVQQTFLSTSSPGLTIAAVPMGEGKTEAALGRWQAHSQGRRLYFALPTMATTDAMLDRITAFLDGTPNKGHLAHSRALLNPFNDHRIRHSHPDGGRHTAGLTPETWFAGRHRGLLAPVTVGTVDQLLSAVLRHKYNFMRLLGAADATLVLDEVHSYDPYMAELLTRALTWCGALGIDVVLLSATLPHAQLLNYVNAYREGLSLPPVAPGDVPATYPAVHHQPGPTIGCADDPPKALPVTTHALPDRTPPARSGSTITYSAAPAGDLGQRLADLARNALHQYPDAKVGILCNTVNRAQQVYRLCAGSAPTHLLHSRMPAGQRQRSTQAALDALGKRSEPGATILVATQVAEQSLDIDLDVLITELAPTPSLFQRLGRVWRHVDTNPRRDLTTRPPTGHPPVTIVRPEKLNAVTALPYPLAQVEKTWNVALTKGTRSVLRITDIQTLVDQSHVTWDDLATPEHADTSAVEKHLTELLAQQATALQHVIPKPHRLRPHTLDHFTSADALDSEYTATRWNRDIDATALLLSATVPDACHPRHLKAAPTRDDLRALMGATVTLTGTAARRLLNACDVQEQAPVAPEGQGRTSVWRAPDHHPLLRDTWVVDLDHPDTAEWFSLDPDLGVEVI